MAMDVRFHLKSGIGFLLYRAKNLIEIGEQSVLTLGSLWYIPETAGRYYKK